MMMESVNHDGMLRYLDPETRALVRLAAIVTAGDESAIRDGIAVAAGSEMSGEGEVGVGVVVRAVWVEELLLQTYLFAGLPRSLNAMREWRRHRPESVPEHDTRSIDDWRVDGERTCAAVYGRFYEPLRHNIRHLHERLDDWMITEGYGKVLSRPGLDLARRELCIVAACTAAEQNRQLHSHLYGALNVGATSAVVSEALKALVDIVGAEEYRTATMLWARVKGK
jgi:4-carboxymuconolactone decarboxylase